MTALPGGRCPGALALAVLALAALACGDDGTQPPPPPPASEAVASVEVASPIDTLLAVGWGARFTATARHQGGGSLNAVFTWSSTAPDVASVDDDGDVSPRSPGAAVIRATVDGVTGELAVEVVAADVAGAAAVLADPLVGHLTSGLEAAADAVAEHLADCGESLDAGNLVSGGACLGAVRDAASAATDADDRVLLAVLLLLADHAARLLTL